MLPRCDFGWSAVSPGPANVLSLSRHVPSHPAGATRSVAQNEARKRRANERPRVGCCEELAAAALEDAVHVHDVFFRANRAAGDGFSGFD